MNIGFIDVLLTGSLVGCGLQSYSLQNIQGSLLLHLIVSLSLNTRVLLTVMCPIK